MYNPDEECKAMIAELKKLCEEKGISHYTLAKEAGISASTISYLINGKTKPQVYTVLELCNVLNVQISELFDNKDADALVEMRGQYITCEENKLLNCYRHLSEPKRKLLTIYVDMLREYSDEEIIKKR